MEVLFCVTVCIACAGWKRMALLISYFSPEHLRDPVTFPIISGRLIVMPVIQTLVFAKIPGPTRKWVNAMTREWDFTRVISAHFNSPVDAGPEDVRYVCHTIVFSSQYLTPFKWCKCHFKHAVCHTEYNDQPYVRYSLAVTGDVPLTLHTTVECAMTAA